MNRRNFLKNSALALFGFSVLPPAKTYERIWKAQRIISIPLVNPAYADVEYEMAFMFDARTYQGDFKIVNIPDIPSGAIAIIRYKNQDGIWQKVFDDSPIQA